MSTYLCLGEKSLAPVYLSVGDKKILFTDVPSGWDFSVKTGGCGNNILPPFTISPVNSSDIVNVIHIYH